MPLLGSLDCSIQVGNNGVLYEYGVKHEKNAALCYVAIPDVTTDFTLILQNREYISPGLAVYVYIDGVYQCNRAKSNMDPKHKPGTQFTLKGKEDELAPGQFIQRPWKFEPLNIGEFHQAPAS
jgi:hypothetical protein